jgi:hypothetical protein
LPAKSIATGMSLPPSGSGTATVSRTAPAVFDRTARVPPSVSPGTPSSIARPAAFRAYLDWCCWPAGRARSIVLNTTRPRLAFSIRTPPASGLIAPSTSRAGPAPRNASSPAAAISSLVVVTLPATACVRLKLNPPVRPDELPAVAVADRQRGRAGDALLVLGEDERLLDRAAGGVRVRGRDGLADGRPGVVHPHVQGAAEREPVDADEGGRAVHVHRQPGREHED